MVKNVMSDWGAQWNKQAMDYLLNSGSSFSFERLLVRNCTGRCLVLGAGSETNLVAGVSHYVVGINISKEELLRVSGSKANLILGDAHWLPFKKSSFDAIVCKSALHHFTDLNRAMQELRRVLREDGCAVLHEPGLLNPIAFFGRKLFPTNIHVDSERPFIPTNLKKTLTIFRFNIVKEEYYYIFVQFLPILAKWLAFLRKTTLLKLFNLFDVLLCRTFLRNISWIMIFVITKK
jgi:SAM-dependent methyltransferase